jgi:hypothetical protein
VKYSFFTFFAGNSSDDLELTVRKNSLEVGNRGQTLNRKFARSSENIKRLLLDIPAAEDKYKHLLETQKITRKVEFESVGMRCVGTKVLEKIIKPITEFTLWRYNL